jgi:hypothetical protein
MLHLDFTRASDVWSFGILLIEIIQDGGQPFSNFESKEAVFHHTVGGGKPPKPLECDADASLEKCYRVAYTCFAHSPASRPGFLELAERLERQHMAASEQPLGLDDEALPTAASVGVGQSCSRERGVESATSHEEHRWAAEGSAPNNPLFAAPAVPVGQFQLINSRGRANAAALGYGTKSTKVAQISPATFAHTRAGRTPQNSAATNQAVSGTGFTAPHSDNGHFAAMNDALDTCNGGQLGQPNTIRLASALSMKVDLAEHEIRAKAAEASVAQYESLFEAVTQRWNSTDWSEELRSVAAEASEACKTAQASMPLALPNPWAADGVESTSTRYLERLYRVYKRSENPAIRISRVCNAVVNKFLTPSNIKIVFEPLKTRARVLEKVLLTGGDFAAIFDYSRIAIVVPDPAVVPNLLTKLLQVAEFEFVWCTNRLDPEVSAYDSGGYRDFQCLVRDASGWVVELQIVSADMFEISKQCSHIAYSEHRFVYEARKIVCADGGLTSKSGGKQEHDVSSKEKITTIVATLMSKNAITATGTDQNLFLGGGNGYGTSNRTNPKSQKHRIKKAKHQPGHSCIEEEQPFLLGFCGDESQL